MAEVVLCDTNIIIELYKANHGIIRELGEIGEENIALSAVTAGELIYGAFNKKELRRILLDIRNLRVFDINTSISHQHIELLAEFTLSHRLSLPDALIAATAMHHDLPLFTLNVKDFKYIPGLRLHAFKTSGA